MTGSRSFESMLDAATLPILELGQLAQRESHRPRPVYTAHKWFARRFGTAMRGLLVAATLGRDDDFWRAFHGDADLRGTDVADLFIGGGTSLYEAHRLGANVVGVDIDPVACMVTDFELRAHQTPDPTVLLDDLIVGAADQRALYATTGPDGSTREGLHYLWVQQLTCGECATEFDAHPSYVVAKAGDQRWVVCAGCGQLTTQPAEATRFRCDCGHSTSLTTAPLSRGRATCVGCGHEERLIDYARRTGERPRYRMFAIESVPAGRETTRSVPIRQRLFHAPTPADLALYEQARAALHARRDAVPDRLIPVRDRSDTRLVSYNYRTYADLFNDRQLLHLVRLIEQIAHVDEQHRPALSIALSNHLTSNCMLTRYSEGWRQVTPLFSLRAYAHAPRPVELNPWLRGTGRGTFPNAVRKVANAIAFARDPKELTAEGFIPVPTRAEGAGATIITGDSRHRPEIPDASADIILTDPPYLDNVDYSELSDFFVPWLAATGQIVDPGGPSALSLAAKARRGDSLVRFQDGLTDCFTEAARILRPAGRLIFTFQHQTDGAWAALGEALAASGLQVVNVFPMRGDSESSPHRHDGSTTWDAVFVLRHPATPLQSSSGVSRTSVERAVTHARGYAELLGLRHPDEENLVRGTLAASAAGFFPGAQGEDHLPLLDALRAHRASTADSASVAAS
ncbi:hypothetical protein [Microbacterium sp. 1P06AB]|uniref:hypothetical protein n=1 Tax=Microbacterium sp. 1P06AB TaxID=3132289 RepID=UPI0039A5E5D3